MKSEDNKMFQEFFNSTKKWQPNFLSAKNCYNIH